MFSFRYGSGGDSWDFTSFLWTIGYWWISGGGADADFAIYPLRILQGTDGPKLRYHKQYCLSSVDLKNRQTNKQMVWM